MLGKTRVSAVLVAYLSLAERSYIVRFSDAHDADMGSIERVALTSRGGGPFAHSALK